MNLSFNIVESLEKINASSIEFLTEKKLECLKVLNTSIFGKLMQENLSKNSETRIFNSPRVINTECKTYFSFAYFGMMLINEHQLTVTETPQEVAERPYQFRSDVANKIQQTLKSRFNREIQFNHDEMLPEMNITENDEQDEEEKVLQEKT